jgi:hypothetical protein
MRLKIKIITYSNGWVQNNTWHIRPTRENKLELEACKVCTDHWGEKRCFLSLGTPAGLESSCVTAHIKKEGSIGELHWAPFAWRLLDRKGFGREHPYFFWPFDFRGSVMKSVFFWNNSFKNNRYGVQNKNNNFIFNRHLVICMRNHQLNESPLQLDEYTAAGISGLRRFCPAYMVLQSW